ncbi:hypothetical protein Lser_V15G25312 [Lactuca serriola]
MKSIMLSFLMIMMHILSVLCRPLPPNEAIPPHQAKGPPLDQLTMDYVKQGDDTKRIGSNPPSCEHKCYGCSPCDATQVPSISGYVGVAIHEQDSNYKPESWKCKCGRTLYSP